MKKIKLLISCLVTTSLFTSCLLSDGYYESNPTSRELIQSSIYSENANSTSRTSDVNRNHYEDSSVRVDMRIAANKVTLNIENMIEDPILLDIQSATVLTRTGNISKIVTYDQTKTSDTNLSQLNVIVNPKTSYKEDYVAADSLTFNTVGKNRYLIEDWTNKYNCQLIIPYKIIKADGSGKSGIIIVF